MANHSFCLEAWSKIETKWHEEFAPDGDGIRV